MRIFQFSNKQGVRAIILENLRRSWPISLVFFLIMFCSIVFPLLMAEDYSRSSLLGLAITGRHPMIIILGMLLPVIAANTAFRYLFTTSGTTLLHSFPLNRRTLFAGNFISGLVLTFVPFVLVMLALLPFFKMTYPGIWFEDGALFFSTTEIRDSVLPDISDWLLFVCLTLMLLFFMYALAVFASILTGTGSGQAVISYVLNFIVIFVFFIVTGYMDKFLIGFNPSSAGENATFLNPLFYLVYTDNRIMYDHLGGYSLAILLVYIAIAIALAFAARRLYERRRLERAGNPICFRSVEIAITNIITLVGMAGLGLLFSALTEKGSSVTGLIIGCVAGAAITFMAVTMLTQKTTRIFTKKTLKEFGVFAIIGVLFLAFTAFDITGYADRVPAPERVEAATLSLSNYPYQIPYSTCYYRVTFEVTSPEDLKALEAFHREMIEGEKAYKWDNYSGAIHDSSGTWDATAILNYDLRGNFAMGRKYLLHPFSTNEEMRKRLADMKPFREAATLERLVGYRSISAISVDMTSLALGPGLSWNYEIQDDEGISYLMSDFANLSLSENERQELAWCMDRDFLALNASEIADIPPEAPREVAVFRIECRKPNDYTMGYYTDYIYYSITPSYKETLAWLDHNIKK